MCAKALQLCLTLCDPMGRSSPGSSVHEDSPGKNAGSVLLCPPPGDLPRPGIKPKFLTSPALAGGFFTTSFTWEALSFLSWLLKLSLTLLQAQVVHPQPIINRHI